MKILICEDDERLARALKRALEEEMHLVEIVSDGEQAIDLGYESALDLIILDVMLPGIDGLEVCRRLRQGGVRTPILILTARGGVSDRVNGLDAGADDYLPKPFALAELLARLRALGRRHIAEGGAKMQVGDLILDPSTHSAVRSGREINLTVKEFVLLDLLMRHRGLVLTRSQILDHVWELENDLTSNVVDIYIHYLRSKIDKGFDKALIQTVRGVGYRLKA
ncbi:MAG: response regulator [Dehalococcoidia bacterium]|nr:response regulator [Dehalococcoidia bacterium]